MLKTVAKGKPSWRHKEIFPSIQEAIERTCERKREACHQEIVDELLKDPEARRVIDIAVQQLPRYHRESMAGIMIAALSKTHTERPANLGQFSIKFDKRKEQPGTDRYTYYPAH